MTIVKVQKGDSIPFIVTGVVRDVPATNPRYGPSHKFVGRTPTDPDAAVFMTTTSAERQLTRIGLTLDTVVGKVIEFARPGEYVDINLYTPPNGAAQPVASPAPAAAAAPAPSANGKQAFSAGPHIPGLDPALPAPGADVAQQRGAVLEPRLEALFTLYERCFDRALAVAQQRLANTGVAATHEGPGAMTATLFIQANQKGLGV